MKMMIQPLADFRRRDTSLGKCPQQGLNVGHQDRRRDAFAADVGNREDQTPVGKLHDALRQIAVRVVLRARDHLADQGQDAPKTKAIEAAEQPAARLGEFQNRNPAARPGHAHHLRETAIGIGHVS